MHSEGRGPVTGWAGGEEIDFYRRKEEGRRVRLAGAAGDPFSLSLSLSSKKEQRKERESKDQSKKYKYTYKQTNSHAFFH